MLALQIEQAGLFMNHLLRRDSFDSFLVPSATITTFTTFTIDGQFRPEFYDTDTITEEEAAGISEESNVTWKSIRPFCFQLMKGRRLPLAFQIVLQMPREQLPSLLEKNELIADPDNIFGLFLNIQYKNNALTVTTGSSLKGFTMDHSIDQIWDAAVRELLSGLGLD